MAARKDWRLRIALCGACLWTTANAQSPETLWRCWQTGGASPQLACVLATAAAPSGGEGAESLPTLVARIRRDPASLDGETILIPLHAPPIDAAFSERLARSVMCGGRRTGCRVEFMDAPQGAR